MWAWKSLTWGAEDIDIEGADPISKIPPYVLLSWGKAKVPKEIDENKITLFTLLLIDKITFEGLCLAHVPHLKMEDWGLADTKRFPHLVTDTFMYHIFYKDIGVIVLEPRQWINGVDKARLLNLFWVPHYNHAPITLIVIKQWLFLVHDGCLWLEDPIPITNMLIHRITLLLHLGLNPAMAFGRKMGENNLTKRMKNKFKLAKKPRSYSISNIIEPVVKVAT